MGARGGTPELLFVLRTSPSLFRGGPATATTFGEGEIVAVVAVSANQIIEFEGPVLSTGIGAETIEDVVFGDGERACARVEAFVKQQTMTTESFGEVLDGGVGNPERSSDLPVPGAGHFESEDGFEQIGTPQPVAGREGLRTEGPATGGALETLHAQRGAGSSEVAVPFVVPTLRIQMEFAARVGTDWMWRSTGRFGHACLERRTSARNTFRST